MCITTTDFRDVQHHSCSTSRNTYSTFGSTSHDNYYSTFVRNTLNNIAVYLCFLYYRTLVSTVATWIRAWQNGHISITKPVVAGALCGIARRIFRTSESKLSPTGATHDYRLRLARACSERQRKPRCNPQQVGSCAQDNRLHAVNSWHWQVQLNVLRRRLQPYVDETEQRRCTCQKLCFPSGTARHDNSRFRRCFANIARVFETADS